MAGLRLWATDGPHALALGSVLGWSTLGVIELRLHRDLTHRSVAFGAALGRASDALVWMLTSLNPAEWVGVHRIHHRFADGARDPHAPAHHGALHLLVTVPHVYRRYRHAHGGEVAVAATDLASRYRSAAWRSSSLPFQVLRRAVPSLVLVGAMDSWVLGLVASGTQLVSYSILLGYVTVAGHWSRSSGGVPVNRRLSGVLLFGTGLHANHHARPRAASQRVAGFEVDSGWLVLRGLAAAGLVDLDGHAAEDRPGRPAAA